MRYKILCTCDSMGMLWGDVNHSNVSIIVESLEKYECADFMKFFFLLDLQVVVDRFSHCVTNNKSTTPEEIATEDGKLILP